MFLSLLLAWNCSEGKSVLMWKSGDQVPENTGRAKTPPVAVLGRLMEQSDIDVLRRGSWHSRLWVGEGHAQMSFMYGSA